MQTADAFKSHLTDCARRAERGDGLVFTDFMDPVGIEIADQVSFLRKVPVMFYGGYGDAERKMAVYGWTDETEDELNWPMAVIKISWNAKFADCTHRDLLGSLMAIGMDRASFGDIIVDKVNACAYLFVQEGIADYIIANWTNAGRAAISCTLIDGGFEPPEPVGVTKRITVQSMRVDSVVAGAYNISRSEAQSLIRAGKLKYNHAECIKVDQPVENGDLLSLRGYGRAKVITDASKTRKDRLAVEIFVYKG